LGDLDDLLVDEEEINEEILFETLNPYLKIGQQSGQIVFEKEFNDLSSKKKVLIALLGIRAMYELDKREEYKIGPKELSNITEIPEGTIYPKLRELDEDGISSSNDDGHYWVSNRTLSKAKAAVGGE
jgi:hypothetical protein